jgi:hypothetical protein
MQVDGRLPIGQRWGDVVIHSLIANIGHVHRMNLCDRQTATGQCFLNWISNQRSEAREILWWSREAGLHFLCYTCIARDSCTFSLLPICRKREFIPVSLACGVTILILYARIVIWCVPRDAIRTSSLFLWRDNMFFPDGFWLQPMTIVNDHSVN